MGKRIAIDLVPIRVGEGGTGSGIWTYARELLNAMDGQIPKGVEILCLVNDGQMPYLNNLEHIRFVPFRSGPKNVLRRLFWVHVRLPLYCLFKRIHVLHKLATDTPWWCSAKRVTTVHDFYYEYLMEQCPKESIRLYEWLENIYFSWVTKTCFRKSKGIIAVSQATHDEAVRRFPQALDRISVIHHGSLGSRCQVSGVRHEGSEECERLERRESQEKRHDPEASSLSTTPKRSADNFSKRNSDKGAVHRPTPNAQHPAPSNSRPFHILCVAKFMEHKGQHLLIKAFERLLNQHPELQGKVHLRLRGFHNDAAYYDRICNQVTGSQYADQIQLMAFNPWDTPEDIYRDADLVVLLSDYEGFGLPVLEAQSCAVPVLCSDLSVLREVGGEGAVYVPRDDLQSIVDALHLLSTNVDFRESLRDRALENVKRFSWTMAAHQTLMVYQGL